MLFAHRRHSIADVLWPALAFSEKDLPLQIVLSLQATSAECTCTVWAYRGS